MFIDFTERGSEKEKHHVTEKHRLAASHTSHKWGLNPQSRHVPRPGIEPAIF